MINVLFVATGGIHRDGISLSQLDIYRNITKNNFNIFVASVILFPITSGTFTVSFTSTSSIFPWFTSKYGKISLNIWPPTGAATPPAWLILATLIFQYNLS